MKRYNRFKMLSSIQDEYILESMPDYVGLQAKKRRENSPLIRFFNSGWGVACICTLVALGVMAFIIRGAWDPINPPVVNTLEETTEATDPTEPATEKEDGTAPFFEEETDPVIVPPDIAAKDYGETIDIYQVYTAKQYVNIWFEKEAERGITPSIYDAILKTETQLGVDIVFREIDSRNLLFTMQNEKAGAVDLILAGALSSISLMEMGYLKPINELPAVNIDAPYWNKDLMDEMSVEGNYYLGYNRFILDEYPVMGYNKTMLAELAPDFDAYETVMTHTWTYDKLASILATTQDKENEWGYDYVGLSMQQNNEFRLMLKGTGIQTVEKNEEDKFIFTFEDQLEAMRKVCKDTQAFLESPYVSAWALDYKAMGGINDGSINLSRGYVLFQMLNLSELERGRNRTFMLAPRSQSPVTKVDVGVLPIPLYDTTQTQYAAYHEGVYWALPFNVVDAQMTGDVMELLAYHGTDTQHAYFTDMLGKTAEEAPEDHKILQMLSRHKTVNLWDQYLGLFGYVNSLTAGEDYNWKNPSSTWKRSFEKAYEKILENNKS